jgi:prephenate dehydratase
MAEVASALAPANTLRALDSRIQDASENFTRFFLLQRVARRECRAVACMRIDCALARVDGPARVVGFY